MTQFTNQTQSLQSEVDSSTGFLYLGEDEQSLLEAAAEAIIPSDSNGAGAKEAGVIYFIDRQLASDYGTNGRCTCRGRSSSQTRGPITVEGMILPARHAQFGVSRAGCDTGTPWTCAIFWRWGLDAMQTYANGAYGGNFEKLSAAKQLQVSRTSGTTRPPAFNDIVPLDFAYELYIMVWAGFLWIRCTAGTRTWSDGPYTGFNGTTRATFTVKATRRRS